MSDEQERERLVKAVEDATREWNEADNKCMSAACSDGEFALAIASFVEKKAAYCNAERALRDYDARHPRGGEEG